VSKYFLGELKTCGNEASFGYIQSLLFSGLRETLLECYFAENGTPLFDVPPVHVQYILLNCIIDFLASGNLALEKRGTCCLFRNSSGVRHRSNHITSAGREEYSPPRCQACSVYAWAGKYVSQAERRNIFRSYT
jgi:hypothetical protein